MTTVSQDFTATGNGNGLLVRTDQSYTYVVTGTFAATWVVEQSKDGSNFVQIDTGTGTQVSTVVQVDERNSGNVTTRFRISAFTSGTVETVLADQADITDGTEFEDGDGIVQFRVVDGGIQVPGTLAVTGVSTLSDNLNISGSQILPGLNTLTDATTIATDCDLGNVHEVTLTDNRTLGAPTNLKAGGEYKWIINQDSTGSRTLAYNAVFLFQAGVAPVLSTGVSAVDVLVGVSDGTNIHCTLTKDFS